MIIVYGGTVNWSTA